MASVLKEMGTKLVDKGLGGVLKALGRKIHYTVFQTPWNFELIPSLLNSLASLQNSLTIVQVGANVGNTESDPLYNFFLQLTKISPPVGRPSLKAILIEPVPYLFKELSSNYAKMPEIILENVAIAASPGPKMFYSLRPGIDLKTQRLPPWSYQLGSFSLNQLESLWKFRPDDPSLRNFVEKNTVAEKLPCETLSRLCEKHDLSKIDFLQVDAEGHDFEVITSLDFNKLPPHHVNYERIHLKSEESKLRRFLSKYGYVLKDHGQDTLASRVGQIPWPKKVSEWFYCVWLDMIF